MTVSGLLGSPFTAAAAAGGRGAATDRRTALQLPPGIRGPPGDDPVDSGGGGAGVGYDGSMPILGHGGHVTAAPKIDAPRFVFGGVPLSPPSFTYLTEATRTAAQRPTATSSGVVRWSHADDSFSAALSMHSLSDIWVERRC